MSDETERRLREALERAEVWLSGIGAELAAGTLTPEGVGKLAAHEAALIREVLSSPTEREVREG